MYIKYAITSRYQFSRFGDLQYYLCADWLGRYKHVFPLSSKVRFQHWLNSTLYLHF
jgi:hypothetical protein